MESLSRSTRPYRLRRRRQAPPESPKGAIGRAWTVLELLAREQVLTLSQILEMTTIPPTTLNAILKELTELGLVSVEETRPRRYSVGLALPVLASRVLRSRDPRDVAHPFLERLASAVQGAAHLAVLSDRGDSVIYVDKVVPSPTQLNVLSFVGATAPVYSTALGKVLVAHCRDSRRQEILSTVQITSRTPRTVRTIDEFAAAVSRARADEVAFDLEENEVGVRCCAAPVFNLYGECIAALSATCSIAQYDTVGAEVLADLVARAAADVSSRLGFPLKQNT